MPGSLALPCNWAFCECSPACCQLQPCLSTAAACGELVVRQQCATIQHSHAYSKASQKGEMISKTSSDPRAHKHLRRCLQDQFWFQSMEVYGTHLTGKVLLKKGTEF